MCDPITAAVVVGVATGASIYQGEQQRKQAKAARQDAAQNAQQAQEQADKEFNMMNKKQPNVTALQGNNTQAAKSGVGSTLLTGSGGIGADQLQLAQNTLLGG